MPIALFIMSRGDDMSTFSQNVEQLLAERGIGIMQFQRDLGLAKNTVNVWREKGSMPRPARLHAIADYFGVTVDYLTTPHDPDEYDKDKALVDRIVQQVKAEIKNPTADISSERQKIIDMLSGLDEERLKEVKSYLEYLASKDK